MRLEGDSRSHRNCRRVYSPLADAAAIAVAPLVADPTDNSHGSAVMSLLSRESSYVYHTKKPMTKQVPRDTHAQCYKRSQLLHRLFTQCWVREPEHAILANLFSPHTVSSCYILNPLINMRCFHWYKLFSQFS